MIAYVCGSASWGGLEMNQWRNAKWMKERAYKVVVLGIPNSELHRACLEDEIAFEPIDSHKKHYDFKAAWKIGKLLKKLKVEHVIIRDGRDMSLATMAKNFSFRQFKVHYFMEMQLGVVKKNIAQTLRFRQLDSWICPLEWLVKEVRTNTYMPSKRIHLIPVGVELSLFQSEISQSNSRKLIGLPEEGIIIGLAGRHDVQKGQLVLMQSLKLLKDSTIPFSVALLGSPTLQESDDYSKQVMTFIEQEGLSERVHCFPFRKDHHNFYKAIDVLVMASLAETCGMVTIEAMASGIPVIGSNAGGTTELLESGNSGYLFETMNPEALALQIVSFLEQPNRFSPEKLLAGTSKFDHHRICEMVERTLGLK